MSKKISVYDPAMCCPSGVCGPSIDPKLAAFSADLDWLANQGIVTERFNLAQQPNAFIDNEKVKAELQRDVESLPLTLLDGEIVARGVYPDRATLAKLCGIEYQAAAPTKCSCDCKPGSCG